MWAGLGKNQMIARENKLSCLLQELTAEILQMSGN